MRQLTFSGRVLPLVFSVSIDVSFEAKWEIPEIGLHITLKPSVNNSAVRVQCDLSRDYRKDDLPHIFMRAFDVARAAVDLVAFATGNGFSVIFEKIAYAGKEEHFVTHDVSLAPLCTAYNYRSSDLAHMLSIVISEPPLFFALRELIEAITLPHQSSVNCARAIDTLRAMFVPAGGRKEDGWPPLRKNLNLARSYIDLIMDTSKGPRHGDHSHIPGTITIDVTRRAWIVMNRFLEFRKRKNVPLPESEFPVLT